MFWAGPMSGSLIAALVYEFTLRPSHDPVRGTGWPPLFMQHTGTYQPRLPMMLNVRSVWVAALPVYSVGICWAAQAWRVLAGWPCTGADLLPLQMPRLAKQCCSAFLQAGR